MSRITKRDLLLSGLYPDEIEVCSVCGNACAGTERVEGEDVCDECRWEYGVENPTWEEIKRDIEFFKE